MIYSVSIFPRWGGGEKITVKAALTCLVARVFSTSQEKKTEEKI